MGSYTFKDKTAKTLNQIIELLSQGEIGVLPTDTIYGIHASIIFKEAIEKIYNLKRRDKNKPMIILIPSIDDLKEFGIKLNQKQKEFLKKIWPEKVSVLFNVPNDRFIFLHRGTKSLAFRLPKNELLQKILKQTGPLVSTSVNLEGQVPAENITQAKKYFGDKINFYLDAGDIKSSSSTLIKIQSVKIQILRQGEVKMLEY